MEIAVYAISPALHDGQDTRALYYLVGCLLIHENPVAFSHGSRHPVLSERIGLVWMHRHPGLGTLDSQQALTKKKKKNGGRLITLY
jgi:hypothetical protein